MIAPLIPQLTEKSYDLAKNHNIYVFKVATKLNKAQIKRVSKTNTRLKSSV